MEGGQTNEFRPLILVAEDDDSNFKLIKAIIGKKCDIQWAKNGEEIVALFKEYGNEAKAILMDIKMPVMDGIEALKEIKAMDPGAKVVMCSAMGQEAMVVEAIKLGALDFIVKPFKAERILQTVKKILD